MDSDPQQVKRFTQSMFGNIGLITLVFQTVYYVSIASYIGFVGACIYALVRPSLSISSKSNETLMVWILVTSAVAFLSGGMFLKFEKGGWISVPGSILYLLNFISMIGVFLYA